nr:MAG TPA: hypothetical protein [Caudoviricetes sp.]
MLIIQASTYYKLIIYYSNLVNILFIIKVLTLL